MRLPIPVNLLLFAVLLNTRTLAQQAFLPGQDPGKTPAPVTAGSKEKSPKFFASLSVGGGFPTGKFAAKNGADSTSGLAKAGPSLSVSAGYMFTPALGIAILAGGQENKQDEAGLSQGFKKYFGSSENVSTTTHNWKTGRILVGGIARLPLSKTGKLYFQSKVLAGILKTSIPAYSYIITSGSGAFLGAGSASPVALRTAFCYQASAGIEWRITRALSLVPDISYFQASPVYHQDHYYVFNPGGGTTDKGPYERKYSISSLNLMIGAQIRF